MKIEWIDTPEDPEWESTEEDREFLDPLENASELYDRYLKLSRITDLTPDKPEPYSYTPPPLDFGFRDTPAGIVFNKTTGRSTRQPTRKLGGEPTWD